jgi:ribose transport system permease protein
VETKRLQINAIRKIDIHKLKGVMPYLGLLLVIIVFGIATGGRFLNIQNLLIILNQAVVVIIAGTGVAYVISMGSLDFSPGASSALSAALGAIVISATNSAILGFLTIISFALLTGLLIGIIHTKFKVPSFVLTLSILFMYRGLAIMACRGGSIGLPLWMRVLDTYTVKFGVLIFVFIIFFYIFTFTRIGVYCRAIGSNEIAAKFSGGPVEKVKIQAFTISGLLIGVAASVLLIKSGGVSTKFGIFLEVDVLTALVLGGLPITGGSGSKMRSIILGAFLLMALSNGLLMVGTTDRVLQLLKGLIFLIVVALSFDRRSVTIIK